MNNQHDEDRPRLGKAGYKMPPHSTRFTAGKSGNPRGRPKARHREVPYEAVLGQMVTVRDAGTERLTSAAEAFLLQLAKQGLEGDGPAARAAMRAIEGARIRHIASHPGQVTINSQLVDSASVNSALIPLRMAKLLDPYRDSAHIMLEPWIVEAALAGFGDRRLTAGEQRLIVNYTRTPHKVRWPPWWTEKH